MEINLIISVFYNFFALNKQKSCPEKINSNEKSI